MKTSAKSRKAKPRKIPTRGSRETSLVGDVRIDGKRPGVFPYFELAEVYRRKKNQPPLEPLTCRHATGYSFPSRTFLFRKENSMGTLTPHIAVANGAQAIE